MATENSDRKTIIGKVGLLGASSGIVLGLIEADCLSITNLPLPLQKPIVHLSIWFFAPLLVSVAFGLVGLLAGFFATLPKSRFLGTVIIASLVGLAGGYLGLVLSFYPSSRVWFVFLREIFRPSLIAVLVFGCGLAALLLRKKADSPLGVLGDIPMRPWSLAVLGSIVLMAMSVGISQLPDHLMDSPAHGHAPSQSPNIVLIVWDTARADHLSAYGYSRNTTPNVDQFAKRGVLFENAVSPSSWTLPAMASIFTSLMPHQHAAGADTPLGGGPKTLAEVLRIGGYETVGFNANPGYGTVPWGLARGFETYVDSTGSLGYSLDATRLGHEFIEPISEEVFHRSRFNQFTAHQMNEQVYRWLNHRSDRPFFLFLNYNDAHDNYEVPSPYDQFYGAASNEAKFLLPEEAKLLLPAAKYGRILLNSDQRETLIAAYDNALRYIDSQVGELLRSLERSPEWSNTYVIITADHGEAFGEHGNYTHGWDLYREVLHVPLIVVGPGVPAGVRINHTARTRQIFATVLEWAGVRKAPLHAENLAHLWNPNYVPNSPEEPALSELVDATPPPASRGIISITTTEWHFIYRRGSHRSRLYHWPTDPLEQHDASDLPENQALVEHLKARIFSIVARSNRPWRDRRYLAAVSGADFPSDLMASRTVGPMLGGPLLPGPGEAQSAFSPNLETPAPNGMILDEDLLKSLPYEAPYAGGKP